MPIVRAKELRAEAARLRKNAERALRRAAVILERSRRVQDALRASFKRLRMRRSCSDDQLATTDGA